MRIIKPRVFKFLSVFCFLLFSSQVSALMVDLNEFTAFAGTNVTINADGLSASLYEDDFIGYTTLEHSGYAMPMDSLLLTFDYSMDVAPDNIDYFDFYLGDLTAPLFSTDGTSSTGALSFDVSAYAGDFLPMIFSLTSDWPGIDLGLESVLTISNLQIVQSGAAVPEPGSFMLMSLGLLGVFFSFRRKVVA